MNKGTQEPSVPSKMNNQKGGGKGEPSVPPIMIVGAGITGLYAAYNLKKKNIPFLVLEKSNKKNIGGRMGSPLFQGTHVAKGAGVGRKKKDKLLIKLLNELPVPYSEFNATHQYARTINSCDVKNQFLRIKKHYEENPQNTTFKEFTEPFLGKEQYKNFITCAGYTDYENEAVESTLYHYGFEDNYNDWIGLSIPWTILLEKLIDKIGSENIHTNTNVLKIENQSLLENRFIIHTEKGKTYQTNNIILATTVNTVRKLLKNKIYNEIESQPFLRIYGKFSKDSIPIMNDIIKTTTILPGALHKLIPINPEEGIYMIAYTDNKGAKSLRAHIENNPENRDYLVRLLERALGIKPNVLKLTSIIDFYWEEGTHYYKPMPKDSPYKNRKEFIKAAQHPQEGIMVIGEMVSQNQGWVEGALESFWGNRGSP